MKFWLPNIIATMFVSVSSVVGQSLIFDDVTSSSLLSYPPSASVVLGVPGLQGVSVGDYDGDGWDDICFCGNSQVGVLMFRNLGDKTFQDVTSTVLPAGLPNASTSIFADIDNDGDLDLVMARHNAGAGETCLDYLINDNGVFIEVGSPCKGALHSAISGGLSVADPDRDGDLDIAITHWGGPAWYFVNSGALSFTEVASQIIPGLETSRMHWTPVFADFNNDGMVDLHVAVDVDEDFHANNQSSDIFTDISTTWDSQEGSADMGIACGDIENDGDLDFFVTNIGVHMLHVNDGSGLFSEEGMARNVDFNGQNYVAWGTAFVDFDHDTDVDLIFVTTGGPEGSIFENDGLGYFTDVTVGSGMALRGSGLVPFDYDKDGDIDLIVADVTGPFLYENVTPMAGKHWIQIDLKGIASNTTGIGSRITVTINGQTMIRELLGNYSFYAGPPVRAHFGLGSATLIDTLQVEWPSGNVQILNNVAVDRRLVITESGGIQAPTMSSWALVVMMILIVTAGNLVLRQRKIIT